MSQLLKTMTLASVLANINQVMYHDQNYESQNVIASTSLTILKTFHEFLPSSMIFQEISRFYISDFSNFLRLPGFP